MKFLFLMISLFTQITWSASIQNPVTKDLLCITYAGTSTISFCHLKPHVI